VTTVPDAATVHFGPPRRLFDDVRTQLGARLVLVALLMVVGALLEGIGLLALLPLLASTGPGPHAPSWLGGRGALIDPFLAVLALFVVTMVVRALVLLARDRATARLEAEYDVSLRSRAAATLAARGWPFAGGIGQAGMQTLLANDVPRSTLALHQGLAAATTALILIVQLVVAAILSLPMAAGALVLLAVGLPSLIALSRRGRETGEQIVEGQEASAQAAYGFHAGLKAALAQERVGDFLHAYHAVLDRLGQLYVAYSTDLARSRARHGIAAAAAAALVIAVGHLLHLELARLVALLILFARMSGPAQALQQALVGIVSLSTSFAAIEARLGPLAAALPAAAEDGRSLDWERLECRQLSLSRGPRGGLASANFTLSPGEWIAVTGPSGAGKTTLLDIVAGLLDADSGELLVDGTPLDAHRAKAWRRSLSYVGQQELPFDISLRAALGAATDDEAWDALRLVQLDELVRHDPAGLAMPLADRGARLSGGERQRLMIARAMLRRPRLLLLDEATAAIDVAGEGALIEALRAARPQMAALLVSHRAESAALCDRSIAIDPPR
jgi:ABC-type multidrug transport system fused ATPase/permease subunit